MTALHRAAIIAGLSFALMGPLTGATLAGPVTDLFASVCLTDARFDFRALMAKADEEGFIEDAVNVDPELESLIAVIRDQAEDPEFEGFSTEIAIYKKTVEDRLYHLIVDRVSDNATDYEPFTLIGCYVYDFDATEIADPQEVTALLEHPVSHNTLDDADFKTDPARLVSYVWGPPPKFPRQFDTYLTFIPEGSDVIETTGFSGLVLKTATSEPYGEEGE